jgi:DNA-binding CsgD family transcriptional regulator
MIDLDGSLQHRGLPRAFVARRRPTWHEAVAKAGDHVGIAAHQGGGEAPPGGSFAFVGRRRELGILMAALEHLPTVVLVEGAAGIGKSRLVYEAVTALDSTDVRVLTGFCHPLREPFPFGPVVDALRKIGPWLPEVEQIPPSAGALARLLPDLADRLPSPPPRAGDAYAERYQLLRGLLSFLDAVGPVVLVIEDIHWVDDATRDLLLLLTRDMPAHLGLVLTCRTEDLPPGALPLGSAYRRQPGTNGAAIHLDPLSKQAVQDLARDALGAHATPKLGRVLYDRSEGLPLAAEEDLITLRERGQAGGAGAADLEQAELPRGLQEAFIERLAALSPAACSVVEAAAVLGVPATEQVLAQVAALDPEQGAAGLTEALRSTILAESGSARYFFRHVLAQKVAYQQMPGPQRSRLHRRTIEVLQAQSPPPLVQIAHHTLQLGDHDAWLRRAEAAVDQAIALGDNGTAAMLLRRILEQPGLAADLRSRAALALAGIAVNGADYVNNAAALRRILADPQLPRTTRGDIRLSLGRLMTNQAGDRAGNREIARAVEELADRPDRAARAMIALAMNERDNTSEQTRGWMDQAEALVRDGPHEGMRAAVQATRLSLRALAGDPDVWALLDQLPRRTDDIEVLRQTARALCNTGEDAIELGHDRRAARLLTEGRELADRAGSPYSESHSRIALLRLEVLAGDWDDVAKRFAALRREYPDMAMAAVEEALVVGMVAAARGQRGRALELLTAAATHGEAQFEVTVTLRSAAGLAALRLAEGAPNDAWEIAAPAVEILRRAGAWARGTGLVPVAVEAALACDDLPGGEQLVSDTKLGLQGLDAPAATAEFHLARAILLGASGPAAAECFDRARQLWSDIGRPYDTARAVERLGVASAAADPAKTAARLQEALAIYTRLGATYDVARAQRTLQELGLAKPAARGRRGYGNQLSPREKQVAELVAQGATNRDIAETLFLSPRTIEEHVARVLQKLGATRGNVGAALKAGRH